MIEDNGKYYIYRHTTLDTNEVFYVGRGTKPEKIYFSYCSEYTRAFSKTRGVFWKRVVNRHPYTVEILLETNDFNFLCKKEIEFIKLYGRRDKGTGTLVNLTDGGFNHLTKLELESLKQKSKIWNRGNHNNKSKNKGAHLKKFKCTREVLDYIASINMKSIEVYNLKGEFIQEFKSLREAASFVGSDDSTIRACLLGKRQKQSKGYRFKYKEDTTELKSLNYLRSPNKPVICENIKTGKIIKYINATEAAKDLAIPIKKIINNIGGFSKVAAKLYKFKYEQ